MFQKGYDSDQSLSEEEDLSQHLPGKFAASTSDPFENKGPEMQVLSELEKLQKYAYPLDHGSTDTTICNESQGAPCVEDEIEFPAFNNKGDNINHRMPASMLAMDVKNIDDQSLALASVCDSEEEIVSIDEKISFTTTGSVKLCKERDTWLEATEEVAPLVQLNESTCLSSKEYVLSKDGRTKVKPNFLFRFQSQKEDFPLVGSDKGKTDMLRTDLQQGEELEVDADGDSQRSMPKSFDIFNGGEVEPLHKNTVLQESSILSDRDGNSVASFLANLQNNSDNLLESSKQPTRLRRRRKKIGFRRSISPLSDENIDEDSLMDGRSSADDEGDFFDPKPILQQKTMADLFHDALGAVPTSDVLSEVKKHTLGVGLFDKLQHVILSEKKKDVEFLERSIIDERSKDGKSCIDVRILSRSLEAKHNVCCCAIICYKESSEMVNPLDMTRQLGERNLTVIFSSRICGDVELEVGNVIRIRPPWKEVRVRGQADVILLSTYFFQV